ncbi:MAG: hypothetical protein AABX73_02855 [Nanoarchaeota archaeon]
MLSSTVALAAAANYPMPFVQGGNADVAVIWGSTAAPTDLVAVTDIVSNLQAELSRQTATGGTTTTGTVSGGEAFALFTGSSKIYINDSLNKVKSVVTDSNLPIVLKDGTFEGDVTSTYEQTVTLNNHPRLKYSQQPTSSDDPIINLALGTTNANHIYNLTVTFNKAINLSHADSEGAELNLFGQKLVVGAATDNTNLILLKSAEKIALDNIDKPSGEVTINGKTYTVELVSASDSGATVRVTDADGKSDEKQVNENASKKINGLEVSVSNADETNQKLSARVTVGADKIKFADNAAVKVGTDETTLDGTNVRFGDKGESNLPGSNFTKIVIQISAKSTDNDALVEKGSFIDPVFGSMKLDFPTITTPLDSTDREEIVVAPSGSDIMSVKFATHDAKSTPKTIEFYYNKSVGAKLATSGNTGNDTISVIERARAIKDSYIVTGNQDEGALWRVKSIQNDTSSYTSSTVELLNVFTDKTQKGIITADGTGTIDLAGKSYTLDYSDNRNVAGDEWVRLRYPDGSRGTANTAVIYPTIQTAKGARMFFYTPMNITLSKGSGTTTGGAAGWDGANGTLATLKFPDGDGYTSVTVTPPAAGEIEMNWTFTVGSTAAVLNTSFNTQEGSSIAVAIGQLTYNFTNAGSGATLAGDNSVNVTKVYLNDVNGAKIVSPAIVLFEEQDDSSGKRYEAIIVKMEGGGTTASKIGVSDVETTWGKDGEFDEIQAQKTNNKQYKSMDFWGSIITTDQSDSDAYSATISYPDSQVSASLYLAEDTASISGGTTSGGTVKELGNPVFADTESASFSGKNLIVIGGSCVNSVAASLLGSSTPLCGADFTTKTTVGAGQFLVETFSRTGGKIATLVAGYHAPDTTNAAKYLTTQKPDTTAGKKFVGTTATQATLVEAPSVPTTTA